MRIATPLQVIVLAAAPAVALAAPEAWGEPRVSADVRHDTSPPLDTIAGPMARAMPERELPLRVVLDLASRHKPFTKGPDPVAQTVLGPSVTPLPLASFPGLSDDDNAAVNGFRIVPPDTNGDVGPNDYVQFINLLVAVYDREGNLRPGFPKPGNAIWQGFGGICEANNDGDPIVQYDPLADRWVLTQFAIGPDGHQCVAVSATGDPAGAYHRYDFVVSPGALNDYPKLGVWPDAYYLTVNEFASTVSGYSFSGPVAVAFERAAMLAGDAARMVKFGPIPCGAECFFSLQPSDLDGPPPAAGTPNTFVMAFDDETWGSGANADGYRLWDFAVSWADPAASTFTALGQVDAPEFDSNLCNFNVACIPEPRGERLDSLSQFTMYRSQARAFAGYRTLLVTHTVDATGHNVAGVRWTELRNAGAGWFLAQTGTLAPGDGNHRWLGSAAMDRDGNIAIGYSVSGRSLYPSIRYAVHEAGSAPGTVGSEVSLQEGSGAQRASYNRWGDYSSMSLAPDGCTFWYTNEYYETTGTFDFKTRIGSFQVCSPP